MNTLLVAFLEQQGYTVTALITFNLVQDNEVMEESLISSYHYTQSSPGGVDLESKTSLEI